MLIFRTLDALRVFDVFYVFFGSRLDTQTMAIYTQSTIVGDGYVGYGAAVSVAIFLIIAMFVVIYVTFMRVTGKIERHSRHRQDDADGHASGQPEPGVAEDADRPDDPEDARSGRWSP